MIPLLLLLAGCASAPGPEPLTVDPHVQESYWAIQAAQQQPRPRKIPILLPERIEDGAKRVPTVIELEVP